MAIFHPDEPLDFVPLPEVARQLGVHPSTASRLVAAGKFPLPTVRVGRKIVVPRTAYERAIGVGS